MKVGDLLKKKGPKLVTSHPSQTVGEAVALLHQHRIGALPVVDAGGKLVGIVSERDVVRGLAIDGDKVLTRNVSELMTRDVVVCRPADLVRDAMLVMSQRHVRHLPVVDGGGLTGIISQRDAMKSMLEEAQLEVNVLRDYARAKS